MGRLLSDHWSLVSVQLCDSLQPLVKTAPFSISIRVHTLSRGFSNIFSSFWDDTRLGGLAYVFLDLADFPRPQSRSKHKSLFSLTPPRTWTQSKGIKHTKEPSRSGSLSLLLPHSLPPELRRSLSSLFCSGRSVWQENYYCLTAYSSRSVLS